MIAGMGKAALLIVVVVVAAAFAWRLRSQRVGSLAPNATALPGEQRVALARKSRGDAVRKRLAEAGLPCPPREIFLRAFKHEAEVEVWAREDAGPFKFVVAFPVLASSGRPGPKRREGDRQVPEGFYRIERFNPESSFHLSLGLDYPNASDRVLGDRGKPGGEIFIHGKNVTIGCLPLGDPAIEELYLLALDVRQRGQREIAVHIFPAHMSGGKWARWSAQQTAADPALRKFWSQLQPGYDAFERTRLVPEIAVESGGRYTVKARER